MIRLGLLLALVVPVALAQRAPRTAAGAQDAPSARYHAGARAFIDGDMAQARAAVDAGLRIAPDHARLQALRDLIEQDQQEQDQQQGGQNRDQAQNQSSGEEGQDGDEGAGGETPDQPPPAEEPEAEQDQTRTTPQDPGQEQEGSDGRDTRQDGDAEPGQAEAMPEGTMSRAQAERILEAVGGEERLLLRELRRAPTRGRRSDKDW